MTISALDTLLSVLHDRGILNETAFEQVCAELLDDQPLTRDHLIRIFGVAPVFALLTRPDAPARLVRDAVDLLTNPDSTIDLRVWVHLAGQVVDLRHAAPTTARIEIAP